MALVYGRYAKAFFDLAVENNAVAVYEEELTAVACIYAEQAALQKFLLNPEIKKSDKKQVVQNIFGGRIETNTLHFLMVLLDKDRMQYLPQICEAFIRLSNKAKNVLTITVISPSKLETVYLNAVSEKFQELYRVSSVTVKTEIDPSLLGGIQVMVGDKLYDASIKQRLLELMSAMTV